MFVKNVRRLLVIGIMAFIFSFLPVNNFVFAEMTSPLGYTALEWVGGSGIKTFMKAPKSAGYIDFITTIDLTQNQIKLVSTSTPRIDGGAPALPFVASTTTENWLFTRSFVESLKANNPEVKFLWDAPFFNVTMTATTLSLGLKSSDAEGDYISSGSRPTPDMEQARRMLIIDNKTNTAKIVDFDADTFVHVGDQAVEGFDPLGTPSSKADQAARVFLGVRNEGKELLVYCSNSASKEEASNALIDAGVLLANQIQVDGGGSATCAYNLPGQYFVEPNRALPHIMGAIPFLGKGTITINNLNVRTGPGVSNLAVRKLALGTTVSMYEIKDGWVRISDTEWVSISYVKKVKTVPYNAKITIDNLNVRKGIGASFAVTRRLKLGEKVRVLEEKNAWVRISDTEWVSGKYVE